MLIKLHPRNVNTPKTEAPKISLSGLKLTIGATEVDLSIIPIGGVAEPDNNSMFKGLVTRDSVEIDYPYSTDIYESIQSSNKMDYVFTLLDGETLACPLKRRPSNV